MRIAIDVVRIYRVMSVGVTPAPEPDGDIHTGPGTIVLTANVNDPDGAAPYTYLWEQTPFNDPGVSFSAPDAATTSFGSLELNKVYYLSLTVTSARLQTKNLRFRILVP